jgi:predicted nucleotidyltransferase
MNPDFAEMLSELSAAGVEYLVVGAFVVDLAANKRSAGRPKDLVDLAWIEAELAKGR